MSLYINANASSMMALSNVQNTNTLLQQNVERLSSGLKINSPADDPSGMVASTQIGLQMSGISQALNNTQDAVNLAKTADGGLSQIQNILQQLRTIAVSAGNYAAATNTELQADQAQITSGIQAIDRVANNTEWGNNQLLNGTAGVQANVTDTADVVGMFVGSTIGGLPPANGAITLQLTSPAQESSLTTNQPFTGTTAIVPQGAFSINGYTFTADGQTQTVQDVANEVNAASAQTGVAASIVANGANVSIQLQATQYGSKFPVNLVDTGHLLDTSTTPAPTVAGTDATLTATVPVTTPTGQSTTTVNFTGGLGPTGSGLELADASGNIVTLTAAGNNGASLTSGALVGTLSTGSLLFQTGQDSGQNVSYAMPDAQTNKLGAGLYINQNLSTIDVTSQQGATQAIKIIDQALDEVSTMRGNLGSFQSGLLQPNISTLDTATQNLSATKSSVLDTDVAAEMTAYTKNQIIEQAGLSILTQANLDPQRVLQLLQKA